MADSRKSFSAWTELQKLVGYDPTASKNETYQKTAEEMKARVDETEAEKLRKALRGEK